MKTNTTLWGQVNKIKDELDEVKYELVNRNDENIQMESLDLLTATMNLVEMLNIPQEVMEEHQAKMIGYQTDPTRMYKIKKWVTVNED